MTDAPTPEVAAYWGSREETNSTLRTLRIRFSIMAALALTIIVVSAIVFFVKVDAKVSTIEATSTKIRQAQVANTTATNQRSNCQDTDFDKILEAVQLVFTGDTNPADYPKVVKC